MRVCVAVIVTVVMWGFSGPVRGDKTDVILMHNGDRVTGEIKSLIRGKLEVSTVNMGTVLIDWANVTEVVSETPQSVELWDGERYHGTLMRAESRESVAVDTGEESVEVPFTDVVSMYPVSASFADRLDVSASLGFSWDKASDVGQYTLGADAELRRSDSVTRGGFSFQRTTQQGRDDTRRASLDVNHFAFRPNKRFLGTFGALESNEELGVTLRSLAGMGYGWMPRFDQSDWFALLLGANVNHEVPRTGNDALNLELVGGLSWDHFRYTGLEQRLAVKLYVFPSVSEPGRVRASFDVGYDFELWSDLFWKLDFYSDYDNEPIDALASTLDYGVTSSVAYKF